MPATLGSELATVNEGANTQNHVFTVGVGKSAAVGDLVVVALGHGSASATFTGISDTKSNTWATGPTINTSAGGRSQMFVSVLTVALVAGDAITVVGSVATTRACGSAVSFVGPFDGNSTTAQAAAGVTAGAALNAAVSIGPTASITPEYLSVVGIFFNPNTINFTPSGGYSQTGLTAKASTTNGYGHSMAYKLSASAGTETATGSFNIAPTDGWNGELMTFKVLAAGPLQSPSLLAGPSYAAHRAASI